MLMMDHKADIDRIMHELEQIEHTEFDDRNDLPELEHSRIIAKEVLDDFMSLLHSLEAEEFEHNGIVYDSKMIEDMSMIAYYICLNGHTSLFDGNLSLEDTYLKAAGIIGCNAEAVMNMKMMYDEYFTNIRNGWPQTKDLTNDMMLVMRVCDNMTTDEVLVSCKRILGFWH